MLSHSSIETPYTILELLLADIARLADAHPNPESFKKTLQNLRQYIYKFYLNKGSKPVKTQRFYDWQKPVLSNKILLGLMNLKYYLLNTLDELDKSAAVEPLYKNKQKARIIKRLHKDLNILAKFSDLTARNTLSSSFKKMSVELSELEKANKPTKLETFNRGIITFNAGFTSSYFLIGMITSFLFSPLTLGIAAGIALVLGMVVAKQHYHSNFIQNDMNTADRIHENKKIIKVSSLQYFEQKKACLELLRKLKGCQVGMFSTEKISKKAKLICAALSLPDTTLDKQLDFLVSKMPTKPSSKPLIDRIRARRQPNMYSRILTNKIWGPALGFFSVISSVYGLMLLVTGLMGVTFLGLSTFGAGLAIIGLGALIGLGIAAIQLRVIKKQEARAHRLEQFYEKDIKGVKNNIFQLEAIRKDLELFDSALNLKLDKHPKGRDNRHRLARALSRSQQMPAMAESPHGQFRRQASQESLEPLFQRECSLDEAQRHPGP